MTDAPVSHLLIGRTRANDVLHRMRDDIVSCVLRPGQKLKFETLREIYGVSFSTLREALSRLASEQLVVGEGQRGFVVAPVTPDGLTDLTRARVAIERECLLLAMANATPAYRHALLGAFHHMDRIEASMDDRAPPPAEWDARHFAFHAALVAVAQSPTLETIRRELWDRARRYRRMSSIMRRRAPGQLKSPESKRAEHRAIAEAVLAEDAEQAVRLLERHVRETTDGLLATLFDEVETAA